MVPPVAALTPSVSFPPPPSPLLTKALDALFLLSPRTWYGFIDAQTKNPLSGFDGNLVLWNLFALSLPLIVASLLYRLFFITEHDHRRRFVRLALVYWLSPWALVCLEQLVHQAQLLAPNLFFYIAGRTKPFASSTTALQERIQQGLAFRTRRYTVLLPPTIQQQQYQQHHQRAILFVPGALVAHDSYNEAACRLADAGYVVVLVSMEPLRFAHVHCGADVASMNRIMGRVEEQLQCQFRSWNLVGHSAGGFACMELYKNFPKAREEHGSNTTKNSRVRAIQPKMALWGMASFAPAATDLSIFNDVEDTSILVVQATNDAILEMTKDGAAAMQARFPVDRTEVKWIEGGTHHGFASYQSPHAVPNDDDVHYQEQQKQACDLTVEFLKEGR